jgi:osmotically-inducible protein OsmY
VAVRGAATVAELPPGATGARGGQYGEHRGTGQGSFAGRGPKGYQRSDERIKEEVSELLTRPMVFQQRVTLARYAGSGYEEGGGAGLDRIRE